VNTSEALEIIKGYVSEEILNEKLTAAWQHIITTGEVWNMSLIYREQAKILINQRICFDVRRK